MPRPAVLFLHPNGKVSRRLPLPFKTRARLRFRRRIEVIAAWLCGHRLEPLAVGLWRACRMW
jgi:hypothetical protein